MSGRLPCRVSNAAAADGNCLKLNRRLEVNTVTRREAREQAFVIIFEKSINHLSVDEILENAKDAREFKENEYILKTVNGVFDNLTEIDSLISENLKGWTLSRISKVCLAVMRLCVYEMKYLDDVPDSVSINEAVELCRKFATEDETSYVNGVLGTVARTGAE